MEPNDEEQKASKKKGNVLSLLSKMKNDGGKIENLIQNTTAENINALKGKADQEVTNNISEGAKGNETVGEEILLIETNHVAKNEIVTEIKETPVIEEKKIVEITKKVKASDSNEISKSLRIATDKNLFDFKKTDRSSAFLYSTNHSKLLNASHIMEVDSSLMLNNILGDWFEKNYDEIKRIGIDKLNNSL